MARDTPISPLSMALTVQSREGAEQHEKLQKLAEVHDLSKSLFNLDIIVISLRVFQGKIPLTRR